MIDAVRDYAIFMLDPTGHVLSWNIGAQRIKGYSAEEIVGEHFSRFYGEADRLRGHPAEELEAALRDGAYSEEGWRVRKDGTSFWASVVITTLRDPDGRHVGFAKVTRDLTERRGAEEMLRLSEERLRLLFQSVKDYAIFMLDPGGHVSTWNSSAANIKGYGADDVLGKHFSLFYMPEDVAAGGPDRALRIAALEGRYEEEGFRVRKDGTRFWANTVLTAIRDPAGALRGFAKVTRDLTERRRLEEEARAAAEEAGAEKARAAEAVNEVQARDEFISVAAHELRTPLTALQLKLQSLQLSLARPEDLVRRQSRVAGALRQVGRLTGLVERLLDVSRLVSGKLVLIPTEIDLADAAKHVLEDLEEQASQSGCSLLLVAPEPIRGLWDRQRLEQVLVNLVSNSIKYGAGKPVQVIVSGDQGVARIEVADQGIGIQSADLERIFLRFERAAPLRHYGGLGLGLYLTKSIVGAFGGSIRVVSTPGKGSAFTVELPRDVQRQRPSEAGA
jgi:PAS domain S-box-containing protein